MRAMWDEVKALQRLWRDEALKLLAGQCDNSNSRRVSWSSPFANAAPPYRPTLAPSHRR